MTATSLFLLDYETVISILSDIKELVHQFSFLDLVAIISSYFCLFSFLSFTFHCNNGLHRQLFHSDKFFSSDSLVIRRCFVVIAFM